MQRPVTGLAVLLLLSAASAAQGALQFGSDERSGSAGRRQPALPPAGLEVEGKAAAASTALDAGAAAVDPIIAGHDCV